MRRCGEFWWGDTIAGTDSLLANRRVESSVLAIPACGSRCTRMVETPARPARTTPRVPRHLVVRPDPYMSHATRTATSGVTGRDRAC